MNSLIFEENKKTRLVLYEAIKYTDFRPLNKEKKDIVIDGAFFDLHKSAILHFWPTQNPLYYTSDLLARGITAALWTCGRSARPLSLS